MNQPQTVFPTSGTFGRYTLITGILLAILGTVGILLPQVVSLGTSLLVAWLMIAGGLFWAYHTWQYNARSFMDWLKPVLLIISGGLMLLYPMSGVAAVGLLLAIYLFLDAFGSFAIASAIRPAPGWGWMIFNGIVSLALALLFLIGWPETSLWLVGLYVSISLVFDGWALIAIGWALRKSSAL